MREAVFEGRSRSFQDGIPAQIERIWVRLLQRVQDQESRLVMQYSSQTSTRSIFDESNPPVGL